MLTIFMRGNNDVAIVIDSEEVLAPVLDVVIRTNAV